MALRDFLKKQFIDVIHWVEPEDGILAWRYPMQDMEIQNGAKLTVRESQMAVFVNEGRIADVFAPGLYTLNTQTLPLLTNLMNWDKMFQSPFKSDVYFFSTRLQVNQHWGTATPITIRDRDFGAVRLRAYGIYSYRVADPRTFHTKVSGTREIYTVAELEGQLRNTIVGRMADTFAESQVPFLDMAANQVELAQKIAEYLKPGVRRPGPGAGQLRGREPVAARGAAKAARRAHRHDHDRRHGPVHAVPGGAVDAHRRGQRRRRRGRHRSGPGRRHGDGPDHDGRHAAAHAGRSASAARGPGSAASGCSGPRPATRSSVSNAASPCRRARSSAPVAAAHSRNDP